MTISRHIYSPLGKSKPTQPPERDAAETAVLRSAIDAVGLAAFGIKERLEAGGLTPDQLVAAVAARDALDAAWDAATAFDKAMDGVVAQAAHPAPAAGRRPDGTTEWIFTYHPKRITLLWHPDARQWESIEYRPDGPADEERR